MSQRQHKLRSQTQSTLTKLASILKHYALRTMHYATHFTSHLLFSIAFTTVFTLYILTLAPGVVGGDAGEHQLAVPLLGIPHTTGYPLYILVGKLWTLLIPIGTPAWRVNLFSAFGGALAAGLTTLVVYRLSADIFPIFTIRHKPSAGNLSRVKTSAGTTGAAGISGVEAPARTPGVEASAGTKQAPSLTRWAGALVAGVVLALGLTLWQWSVVAGVRSFNIFFFALLTLQAITWAQQRQHETTNPKSKIQNPKSETTLRWLALTVGLSLTHHRTTIFYLPSLIVWIWWYDRQLIRHPKRLAKLILLTLSPLLLYLFIYLRGINNPPYTHEKITDLASFWFLVGSGDSAGLFFSVDAAYIPARLAFIWQDILHQLSWPGVFLAALGAIILLRRGPASFFMQALLVMLLLLFTLDFEVVNLNEAPTWYLMPAYFIFAVWLGLGVNGILDFGFWILDFGFKGFKSYMPHFMGAVQLLIAVVVILVLGYLLGWPNWQTQYAAAVAPLDDWRQLLRGAQARRFVESSLPYVEPNSIIWGDWEQYTPFKYYQLVNGLRPEVTVRNPLDRWPEKVATAHAAGQPVYFTRKPADLIGTPYLSMVGPLIQLRTEPNFESPADIIQVKANFEDELELIGYQVETILQQTPGGEQGGSILQLMLYWRAPKKVEWDYALSLRLIDAAGREVYQKDASHPVLSSYPTTLWTPGEVVGDYYELPLPPEVSPLTLHLLPYRTEGPGVWHNLVLTDAESPQEGLLLGPFRTK